jgi:hypothetical protein
MWGSAGEVGRNHRAGIFDIGDACEQSMSARQKNRTDRHAGKDSRHRARRMEDAPDSMPSV